MRNRKSRYSTPHEFIGGRKKKKYGFSARYSVITAVFLLVCLFYVIKMYNIQASGTPGSHDDNGLVERTYTVAGIRGEIYDRNGKLLVGNKINYDIVLEYGSIPDTTPELEALWALGKSDDYVLDISKRNQVALDIQSKKYNGTNSWYHCIKNL